MWLTMWLTTWLTMWLTIWRTRPAAAAGQQPATMMSATAAIAAHCMAHSWLLSLAATRPLPGIPACFLAAWLSCGLLGCSLALASLAGLIPGLLGCFLPSLAAPWAPWLLPHFPGCSLASLTASWFP